MRDRSEAGSVSRIAVLGGGIAGLSTAHQLVKWNAEAAAGSTWYDVTVFESRGSAVDDLGGKARSWRVADAPGPTPAHDPATGPGESAKHDGLAGEHGFRFFPGFYRHVTRTMADIPANDADDGAPRTVLDHLVALPQAGFFALGGNPDPARRPPSAARRLDAAFRRLGVASSVLALGVPVLVLLLDRPWWWFMVWLGTVTCWKTVRWVVAARADDGSASLVLDVRTDSDPNSGRRWSARLRRARIRWWWIALVAPMLWWSPPTRVWVTAALLAVVWTNCDVVLAGRWIAHDIRGSLPVAVRPRGLESAVGALVVLQLLTSCRGRIDRVWEGRSWWEHSRAARLSPRYRLSLATGLTRTFVATRAEEMSAKTGGLVLAQLIYDLNPHLDRHDRSGRPRPKGADRILDGPTSEVWIEPWIAHLRKSGVRFNEFTSRSGSRVGPLPKVLVQSLILDRERRRIDGFHYNSEIACLPAVPGEDPIRGNATIQGEFDRYVMAVSGTSAQWILGNSPDLCRADREREADRPVHPMSAPRPVPHLDGVFALRFGWMTGMVFHLDRRVSLPAGHVLLLESEWALTLVDQSAHWDPALGIELDRSILSVDISDWDSPSRHGIPAKLADLDTVIAEVWDQLCRHLPSLAGVPCPPRSCVLVDRAITDPKAAAQAINALNATVDVGGERSGIPTPSGVGMPSTSPLRDRRRSVSGVLENLPLLNSDRLLINVAGTWSARPTAATSVENLFIAGDYVRTQVDFASMESADESARWVAHGITTLDHEVGLPAPGGLTDPPEVAGMLRCCRAVDRVLHSAGLANPLELPVMVAAWLATAEDRYRSWIERRFRNPGLEPIDPFSSERVDRSP
ncbi:MAG: NAD(P)-binding protein [Microthrixaceae bacterium]